MIPEGSTVLLKIVHGSHLFGTSTPKSDKDYKGVVVPSRDSILMGRYPRTSYNESTKEDERAKNTSADTDVEMMTLKGFMELLRQGQTMALELLFCPQDSIVEVHPAWELMVLPYRDQLVHRGVSAFFGYARQQAAKYGVKGSRVAAVRRTLELLETFDEAKKIGEYATAEDERLLAHVRANSDRPLMGEQPLVQVVQCRGPNGEPCDHLEVCNRKVPFHATVKYAKEVFRRIFDEYGKRALMAEKNEGIDWKALSHAVRVGDQAIELLTTGHITLPRPNAALLLAIKQGELAYRSVAEMIESRLVEMTVLQASSKLPDEVDQKVIDGIVTRIHGLKVMGML